MGRQKLVRAVDDVSFSLRAGENMAWSASRAAANRRWAARCCAC